MKIIINADDFGISPHVNEAIYVAACEGFVTSTTILSVAPYAEEAVALSQKLPISVGIHLALTDDFISLSLGKKMEECRWDFSGLNVFKIPKIIREFKMQIEKLLRAGITITHIDTHHHIHRFPLVLFAVIYIAKKYQITSIRTQILLVNPKFFNKLYRLLHCKILTLFHIGQADAYSDFAHFFQTFPAVFSDNHVIEIMCHPGSNYGDDAIYFNKTYFADLQQCLISYKELT